MNAFAILRLAAFGVVLLFSLICLGISGNFVAQTSGWSFPGFALAVAILTFVITIPMLVIDMLRKGAVVSWVAIELGWVGVLWVLWVATAGLSTSTILFTGDCSIWIPEIETLCRQYSALQAFQWLTWLILFFYFILVIILAIMANVKGNSRVWFSSTSELSFSPPQMNGGDSKNPGQVAYPAQPPYAVTPVGQPGSPMQPGAFPGSPAPTYQTPMHTGGYGAPAAPQMGYAQPAQPGQYAAPYGQPAPPNPNVAQV